MIGLLPKAGQGKPMVELPNYSALRIAQDSRTLTRARIDALDHVVVVLPERAPRSVFRTLPISDQLKRLHARIARDETARITTRLNNKKTTGLTLAVVAPASRFETLTWARKIIGECTKDKPARLGLLAAGFDDAVRDNLLTALVSAAEAAAFRLPAFKSGTHRRGGLRQLRLLAPEPRVPLEQTQAAAFGNNLARWFTALPPNYLTATDYRRAVEMLAREHALQSEFIGERRLARLRAGAFLAVAQGNAARDAGIIHLKYRPGRERRPELSLVGKGILFDTGGTNLKPFKGMLDMHTDMEGSAVALGTLLALVKLKVPYAVDAWLAVSENRLSPSAYKSQDVVTAANGTTIQVIHTDAEGRMVLADTLALAAGDEPGLMIDYATLTGSCIAALTERYSGIFTNRTDAHSRLIQAGRDSGERVWPFPLDKDFDEELESRVADIKQCSADGSGDHILAARFLRRFVPDTVPWIHVDLSAGQHKGGLADIPTPITGFGVRFTLELLEYGETSAAELGARLSSQ
jgi:leucyl aminopeptidase